MAKLKKQSALKVFLSTEYDKLRTYINSRYSDTYYNADADDIIQDVALNVYSKLNLNAPIENLSSYFYRAIRNKIIDLQRKPKYNVSIENYTDKDNSILRKHTEEDEETQSLSQNTELQGKMINAIQELSDIEQFIINQTEFEGKTFEQLSKELKIPIGTLLSKKHRALNKLYKILKTEI